MVDSLQTIGPYETSAAYMLEGGGGGGGGGAWGTDTCHPHKFLVLPQVPPPPPPTQNYVLTVC